MKLISTQQLLLLSFFLSLPFFIFSMENVETSKSYLYNKKLSKSGVYFPLFIDETNPTYMSSTDWEISPITCAWSNGSNNSNLNNLTKGNYNISITDSTGATATDDFFITQSGSLVVVTEAIVGCEGGTSGSMTAIVTGGSFPFSYAWSNGDSVQTATGLSTGNYVVTVTDVNGCEAISSAVFLNQPIEVNSNPFPSSTSCPGGMDGSVTLDVWGGAGGYSFIWSNGATTQNITNVLAGSYSVTVTDTNGCTSSSSVNVDSPSPITLNVQGIGNVSCNGGNDGSIFADAFGGTPGYTYLWNNGDTGSFIDSLGAGTFFATITDAIGCTGIGSVTVNEPEVLETFTFGSSVCNGSDDGTANVVVSGGTQPFTYAWSNGATTPEIENLVPGTYYVTVNDVNQCTAMDSITINLNANILVSNPSSTMVSCPTGNDGTATITPTGGNAPYTYQWSTGSGDSVITNLTAGLYTVTVVDLFNCSFIETYDITQPDPVEINATSVNANCGMANGIIYLNPTGGTSPYNYEWFNGSNADSLANLEAGAYAVNVTDANGCIKQFFVDVIMGNNPPTAIAQNISVSLNDLGQANIDVAQINNGSTDDCGIDTMYIDLASFDCSNLGENIITLTVVDEEDVTSTTTATITVLDEIAPMIITQNITLSLDENGNASLTPAQIDNGSSDNCGIDSMSIDISNFDCASLGENTITLTAYDTSGNMQSDTAVITIIDTIAAMISCPSDLIITSCESVIILDYTIGDVIDNCTTGSPILISGIPSGGELSTGTVTNVFEYVDQSGNVTTCSFNITLQTSQEIEIQIDSFTPATEGNNDGSIEITITAGSGPFQFEWTSDGTVVSTDEDPTGLPAGNYEVMVTDLNGCFATLQVELTTGIQSPALVTKVNLFPNPTRDVLFVKMDLPIELGDKIQLCSIDGKILLEKNLNDGDGLIKMNIENFTKGIYIMRLTINQGVVTKRVIVSE